MARKKAEGAGVKAPARLMDAIVSRIRQHEGEESSIVTDAVAGAKDYISTQSLTLDMALNMPGIPVGRLTVIRGWESSGKSTLITHLVAETLQRGGLAVLLDSEFAFDEERAARIGVDMDGNFLLAQPPTVEASIALIESSITEMREETPDALALRVWDSVGGTPTKSQIENEFGESEARGQHARIISSALRRITGLVAKENIALVIVNQNKELVDSASFRSSETSTMLARHPLQFHASTIIDMRKGTELVLGDKSKPDAEAYGIMARAKITKNKCSNPFGKCEIKVLFDTGFDDAYAHFQAALRLGIIKKKGSWYNMADAKEGAFHEVNFAGILADNDGLRERIATAAREKFWSETVRARFLSPKNPPQTITKSR